MRPRIQGTARICLFVLVASACSSESARSASVCDAMERRALDREAEAFREALTECRRAEDEAATDRMRDQQRDQANANIRQLQTDTDRTIQDALREGWPLPRR